MSLGGVVITLIINICPVNKIIWWKYCYEYTSTSDEGYEEFDDNDDALILTYIFSEKSGLGGTGYKEEINY